MLEHFEFLKDIQGFDYQCITHYDVQISDICVKYIKYFPYLGLVFESAPLQQVLYLPIHQDSV
jgi:hypothetical protein